MINRSDSISNCEDKTPVWAPKIGINYNYGILGVLNLSPDSFYNGVCHGDERELLEAANNLIESEADIIDIGGESTKPDAQPCPLQMEQTRVLAAIRLIIDRIPAASLSCDTWHASTAAAVLDLGVKIINDVTSFDMDQELFDVLIQFKPGYVLMHNRGLPNKICESRDIIHEVKSFFEKKLSRLINAGFPEQNIVLDPGIGFGKTIRDNCLLINHIEEMLEFQRPIMAGVSMKSFFGKITGQPLNHRVCSTATLSAILLQKGVTWHRVHNVRETRSSLLLGDMFPCQRKTCQ